MTLLRFENPGARPSLLEIGDKERILLAGPTGSGKSTLLRQLVLLRDSNTGVVHWNGERVTPQTVNAFRTQAQLVAQAGFRSHQGLREHWSELLALECYRGIPEEDATRTLRALLERLGLSRLWDADRTLHEVSGGELQGFSLARALTLAPRLLLLDEPTSAMDPELKRRAEDLVFAEHSGAWIWVTHDSTQAERLRAEGARTLHIPALPQA